MTNQMQQLHNFLLRRAPRVSLNTPEFSLLTTRFANRRVGDGPRAAGRRALS